MGISGGAAAPVVPGNPYVGELLWAWNKADVSQFEATAHEHERDLGSTPNASTALLMSVVDLGNKRGNALRLTATSLAGGGVFAVKTTELTLPDRYVVHVTYCTLVSSGLFSALYPFYTPDDGGGQFEGYMIERYLGTSGNVVRAVVNNRSGSAESMNSGGTFATASSDRGGVSQVVTCFRQRTADNPALSRVLCEDRVLNGGIQFDGALPHAISGVSTNHDGLNMNRIGIGCWEGVNNTTGVIEFLDLKVFAHPDD